MDILLYSDFLIEYFGGNKKGLKTNVDNIRYNVVQNVNNRIIISDNYVTYLETLFTSAHKFKTEFEDLFLELFDSIGSKCIKVDSINTSTNLVSECVGIIADYQNPLLIPITENNIPEIPTAVEMQQINKPNRHWQLSHLVAYHSVSVVYSDFTNDNQIQDYFDNIISLPKNIRDFYYFDRYCSNLKHHTRFRQIPVPTTQCRVFTYGLNGTIPLTMPQLKALKAIAVGAFGTMCRVHYTTDKLLLHERKVMFNNIILESTDDFAKIAPTISTWKINITYSNQEFTNWLSKTTLFTEIT
jgi:hypothetical protein